MFITTSQTAGTYKASVRGGAKHAVLYTATCTESDAAAARAVVRKFWTEAAANSVRELTGPTEIKAIVGDFMASPHRKQVFLIWGFNPAAR